jgi:hypothetical protein
MALELGLSIRGLILMSNYRTVLVRFYLSRVKLFLFFEELFGSEG